MHSENAFKTGDGMELYAQQWVPESGIRARLVLVHGFGDHSSRYAHVAAHFNRAGIAVHAYDQRGHGKSPGRRAYVSRFDDLLADLDAFLAWSGDSLAGAPLFLMGHSMGGMVLTRYAQTRAIGAAGLVFSSPFLGFTDDVPQILLKLAGILSAVFPGLPVGGVDNRGLSRLPDVVAAADADPLTFHGRVAARTGAQFYATIQAAEKDYGAISLPSLVLHGEADRVVPCAGGVRLFEGMGSGDKTLRLFPGGYHELWNDTDQEAFLREVTGWICARASAAAA
ncbi:MAG TPA: lysophospholipase [Candidatus Hydrogenedentes bacterium]|nr:lysophospholipase [Candidatus Hydrogenedentota bacterium]